MSVQSKESRRFTRGSAVFSTPATSVKRFGEYFAREGILIWHKNLYPLHRRYIKGIRR